MNKRYQVFISSTFKDLEEERREVIQALLELDCIPAGMELFPAADDDQWTLIQRVIDDCDYYLVIVAGRYGSISKKTGQSYTEMEYRYALEHGKPVLGFVHSDPTSISLAYSEADPDARAKLEKFRDLVREKMIKQWRTPKELGGVVSRSMVLAMKTRPAVGWVRADHVPDESSAQELLRLRRRVEELEGELQRERRSPPPGVEDLAQGDDVVEVPALYRPKGYGAPHRFRAPMTWSALYSAMVPVIFDGAHDLHLRRGISRSIVNSFFADLADRGRPDSSTASVDVDDDFLETIKLQFEALGLIHRHMGVDPEDGAAVESWKATPYGREVAYRVRAVRRGTAKSTSMEHIIWDTPELSPKSADEDIPF